jgi:hypothetical protein
MLFAMGLLQRSAGRAGSGCARREPASTPLAQPRLDIRADHPAAGVSRAPGESDGFVQGTCASALRVRAQLHKYGTGSALQG